jgi:hypothetical protein
MIVPAIKNARIPEGDIVLLVPSGMLSVLLNVAAQWRAGKDVGLQTQT